MARAIWFLVTGILVGSGFLLIARAEGSELSYRPVPPWRDEMRVSMEILVGGQPVRTIDFAGKTYLPVSQLGTEYQIRVSNHGRRRIAALVSVDGLSVLNGQPASVDQPGYLVNPHSSIVIKGWRRNLDTVAAFRFEEREKSYAYLMGKPANIGVIGLIAIEEAFVRPRRELEFKDSAGPLSRSLPTEVGETGTGYGRDIDSSVEYVPFVRSSNQRSITFDYDMVDALRKAGVPVDRPFPIPFPGDPVFVPPPPGSRDR